MLDYFKKGDGFFALGNYKEAVKWFDFGLKIYPKSVNFYTKRGIAKVHLKLYDEAEKDLEMADNLDQPKKKSLFYLGVAKFYLKKYDRALFYLNEELSLNPTNAKAFYFRGLLNMIFYLYRDAIRDFDKVLQFDSKNVDAQNQKKIALRNFELKIKNLTIENVPEYFYKIVNEFSLEKYEDALEDCDIILKIDSKNVDILNYRGKINYFLERYDDAIKDFDKVLQLTPNSFEILYHRGKAKSDCGKYEEALKDFYASLSLDQNNELHFLEKEIEATTAKLEKTKTVHNLFSFIKIEKGNLKRFLERGEKKVELGLYREAIVDYNIALEIEPQNSFIYSKIGRIRFFLEEYQKANDCFFNALKFDSENVDLFFYKKWEEKNFLEINEATKQLDNHLNLNPKHIQGYVLRGILKYRLKKYKEASKDFSTALSFDSNVFEALFYRGIIKKEEKRYEEAFQDFEKILKFCQNNEDFFNDFPHIFFFSAVVLSNLKRYNDAVKYFEYEIELFPNNIDAYFYKGVANSFVSHFYAKKDFSKVIALKPDYAEAYFWKGKMHHRLNEYLEAVKCFDEALKYDSQNFTYFYHRAISKYKNSQFKEAMEDFLKVLKKRKKDFNIYFYLGKIYFHFDNYKKALDYFELALNLRPKHKETIEFIKKLKIYIKLIGENLNFQKAVEDYLNQAVKNYNFKKYKKSSDLLDKILLLDSKNIDALYYKGILSLKMKNYKLTLKCFEKIYEVLIPGKITENYVELYFYKGVALYYLKKYRDAFDLLEFTTEKDSKNAAEAYFYMGMINEHLRNEKKSYFMEKTNFFTKALELNPNYAAAYFQRGKQHFSINLKLRDFALALEIEPNNTEILFLKACYELDLMQYKKALEDFNKILKTDSKNAEVYFKKSMLYLRMCEFEDALKNIKKALEINPSNDKYLFEQGKIKSYLGKYKEALKDFDKVEQSNISEFDFLNVVAKTKKKLKIANKEKNLFEPINLKKENLEKFIARGDKKIDLNLYIESISDFNNALKIDSKNASIFIKRGNAKLLAFDYIVANKDFQEALKLEPYNAEIFFLLGKICKDADLKDESDFYFDMAVKLNPKYLKMFL